MRAAEIDSSIPLLDLRRFDADETLRAAFLAELRAAAHDVGFFYVTGHGVETRLLRDVMQSTRRFFALPDGGKRAIEMVNSPHFRGYNRVAAERTRGRPDWREQIDIGAEPPALASHARGPERDPQNPLYREVGLNYLKGRLRSHPDVARRHHADLLEPGAPQHPALISQ